uniref:PNPLA domain-containing protein n=1 Tax=Pyramimonas orientalis virus TaxID=455367 RepID=A0A7M3UPF2_POV01|nr:hypothetical protein HWQ62_00510 [Pyramimonas orientalis virus]
MESRDDMDIQCVRALVFDGGGIKSLAHCGALKQLERFGLILDEIMLLAGTTTGSQLASLLACGYNVNELQDIFTSMPFVKYTNKKTTIARNTLRLLCSYGMCNGDELENYIDNLIWTKLGKKKATFRDLYTKRFKFLRLSGTCLSTSTLEYFDVCLTPNMPISKAVRIACCVPLYYSPIKYNNKYYVDSTVVNHLHIDTFPNVVKLLFNFKDARVIECFGIKQKHPKHKITNIVRFLFALLAATNNPHFQDVDYPKRSRTVDDYTTVITVDTPYICDTEITDSITRMLLKQGAIAVDNVLFST